MDLVSITPSHLKGTVTVPPSKSFAHRALIAAFLSNEPCTIKNLSMSADIKATLDCIKKAGTVFSYLPKTLSLTFKKSSAYLSEDILFDCGESGSTLRFFIPIILALFGKAKFTGHGRLMERPLDPYFKIFDQKDIKYSIKNGILSLNGKLSAGEFTLDGSVSSQFLTGLLFALPTLDGDSRIKIDGDLSSRGYIDITLDVLKTFGIEIENLNYSTFVIKGNQKYIGKSYTIEGDFSQAAFFLVAGALGCDITLKGLLENSLQGDKEIINIIEKVGAAIKRSDDGTLCAKPSSAMHGITVDADEIPDLVPILAVLLSFCKGKSRIENAGRLRIKESDRLAAITKELKKMGADIIEGPDFLEISGKQILSGADISSWNDHRIAMATAIAACRCEGTVTISGAKKAVKKSYPNFFDEYEKLGGIVE